MRAAPSPSPDVTSARAAATRRGRNPAARALGGYNAKMTWSRRRRSRGAIEGARGRGSFVAASVLGTLAFVAMGVSSTFGNVHAHNLTQKLVAFLGTLAFVVLALLAVQTLANGFARVIDARSASRSGGTAVRIIASITGFVLVAFVGLGLLSVSVQHLLIGGALTGVILGIAGQQALGNVFAGLVLLVARPFTVDQHVRIRAGALGGVMDGAIKRIGLAYVTIETLEGVVNVPNSVMLTAGVGPMPSGGPAEPAQPSRPSETPHREPGGG